ncbi:hypothetical protein [Streptomyces sp. YU58]|uniref:hypothetical protein n=1 Tax=Streptomyces sp. SX92 TaxID=3158972 RepID=UPI0027BA0A2A|nr:hypothetical protein [Streptomyces coralus]WLW58062.1 hypothetical protein QU709_44800 [Streptomyces coralus]
MTTPTLRLPTRTAVRAAGLVDVPAVVRLFAPPPVPSGPSVAAADGAAVDWEQAQRAMRLMLAHHALEEGQVWVAEGTDGALLAAGVWMPPGTGTEPPDARWRSLLSRELGDCPPGHPVLPAALKAAGPDGPHWTLVTVTATDRPEAQDPRVVAELLAPGLRAVDAGHTTAVAIALSARHADLLLPHGFSRPHEVRVVPGASVWLTTRRPRGAAAA